MTYEASPRPWSVVVGQHRNYSIQARATEPEDVIETVAEHLALVDAELIVRAVNAHEELLEALRMASVYVNSQPYPLRQEPWAKAVQAAIAKAQPSQEQSK